MTKPQAEAASVRALRRLGKNINGYFGETIDIEVVLQDCANAAGEQGWIIEQMPVQGRPPLLAFSRAASVAQQNGALRRVYVSTGIHGDEPAGPLAVRRLLQENAWPEDLQLWLCPCLSPAGFIQNRRENPDGCDLNRDYLSVATPETKAHTAWLQRQPGFDLCLCLHEDWESNGFYVYELNPDNAPSLAGAIVKAVAEVCRIDTSDLIEGRPARDGIIRPSVDPRSRPDWPEAFYLLTYKTRLSYTLEAPSDFPLECRVSALARGTQAALDRLGNCHQRWSDAK